MLTTCLLSIHRHLGGDLKTDSLSGEEDYLPVNVKASMHNGVRWPQKPLVHASHMQPLQAWSLP